MITSTRWIGLVMFIVTSNERLAHALRDFPLLAPTRWSILWVLLLTF